MRLLILASLTSSALAIVPNKSAPPPALRTALPGGSSWPCAPSPLRPSPSSFLSGVQDGLPRVSTLGGGRRGTVGREKPGGGAAASTTPA
eukprot:scaffold77779_cov30-Phaeocystis_antarctica.AAC.1